MAIETREASQERAWYAEIDPNLLLTVTATVELDGLRTRSGVPNPRRRREVLE